MKSEQAETVRRARSGDLGAFREIHQAYGQRLLNFIYRMVDSREDAEDLAQNVFLRAFRELGGLKDPERFESWLYRIARNEVYQSFRKRRSEPAVKDPPQAGKDGDHPDIEWADSRPTPQDQLLQDELGRRIRGVLRTLPPKLREVFLLAVVDERSYAEVSEIVGRSLLSVKTDIFRARRIARNSLEKYLETAK